MREGLGSSSKGKGKGKGKRNAKGKGKGKAGKQEPECELGEHEKELHRLVLEENMEGLQLFLEANSTQSVKNSESLEEGEPEKEASTNPNGAKKLDINARDQHRRSALHLAAARGLPQACSLLLKAGADIHQNAMDGYAPLHFAAMKGHLEAAKILVQAGASVTRCVPKGKKSPLHFACGKGFVDLAVYLVRKGGKLGLKNSQEQTPLDLLDKDQLEVLKAKLGDKFHTSASSPPLAEKKAGGSGEEGEAGPSPKRAKGNEVEEKN